MGSDMMNGYLKEKNKYKKGEFRFCSFFFSIGGESLSGGQTRRLIWKLEFRAWKAWREIEEGFLRMVEWLVLG